MFKKKTRFKPCLRVEEKKTSQHKLTHCVRAVFFLNLNIRVSSIQESFNNNMSENNKKLCDVPFFSEKDVAPGLAVFFQNTFIFFR